MGVERDRFAGRDDVVDDLRLVVFAQLLEVRDGVVFAPDFAIDGEIAVDDLPQFADFCATRPMRLKPARGQPGR